MYTAWKVSKYEVISGPYFPVFGLNTEIYELNLHIQSEYRKIRTRNNSVFGHFSRSVANQFVNVISTSIWCIYYILYTNSDNIDNTVWMFVSGWKWYRGMKMVSLLTLLFLPRQCRGKKNLTEKTNVACYHWHNLQCLYLSWWNMNLLKIRCYYKMA